MVFRDSVTESFALVINNLHKTGVEDHCSLETQPKGSFKGDFYTCRYDVVMLTLSKDICNQWVCKFSAKVCTAQ